MTEAPRIVRVHIVPGDYSEPMGGVGEPGVRPIPPALCNAIYAATSKRIRRLPIGDQLKVWRTCSERGCGDAPRTLGPPYKGRWGEFFHHVVERQHIWTDAPP